MLRVTLNVRMNCPWVSYISRKYNARITILQCVPHVMSGGVSALVKVKSPNCGSEQISRAVRKVPTVQDATFTEIRPNVHFGIVKTSLCPCSSTILPHFNLINAVDNGDGGLRWTFLVDNEKSLKQLSEYLDNNGIDYQIEEAIKIEDSWCLTEKQEQVIRAALELGFYDIPRRVGLKELAKLFNISPRAVSEILRRAHRRIIIHALETHQVSKYNEA
ncbi:MAG: helix-turn-helix domain-containing protein [Aigarchaeota archaeon]|nr:helix-turn-helix domain-containing protein [Candidatus Pelearchaeum maunauluense]